MFYQYKICGVIPYPANNRRLRLQFSRRMPASGSVELLDRSTRIFVSDQCRQRFANGHHRPPAMDTHGHINFVDNPIFGSLAVALPAPPGIWFRWRSTQSDGA